MLNLLEIKSKTLYKVATLLIVLLLTGCNSSINPLSNNSSPTKIGLLLPYGSEIRGDEQLAISLENSARLAANDLGYGKVPLLVYATEGKPKLASLAAKKAVQDGAEIILGPLRSDVATAAARAVANKNINVLTFSNNSAISGNNLFLLGTTFDNVAGRLAKFAKKSGSEGWLLIYPRTNEGEIAKKTVMKAATKNDITILGSVSFDLTAESIVEAVPEIADLIETTLPDSIMLTSNSAGALPLLGQLLPEKGVDPKLMQYIGLARWDVSKETLRLPGLQRGWFALPDPILASKFSSRYKTIFNQTPHPLASLAYDGVAIIGSLRSKRKNMSSKNLKQEFGFLGVNGLLRFADDGSNERALSIATIKKNKVKVIDPALKSFLP